MKIFSKFLIVFAAVLITSTTIFAQEGNKINSKYDFIPGEKVIFFDDFTSEGLAIFLYCGIQMVAVKL